MEKKIIVLTVARDRHADVVIARLREMGSEPIRLNLGDIPLAAALTLTRNGIEAGGILRTATHTIAFEDIRSILWRRPRLSPAPPELSHHEAKFARRELEHSLRGMFSTLDCYWMSHPGCIRQAGNKFDQLKRAAELGLEIPRTLLTTDPEQVRKFYQECNGKIIFKVLSNPALTANDSTDLHAPTTPDLEIVHKGVYATLVTEEILEKNADQVRNTPCFFQEYIEKKVELRVTVVEDELFVAEIDSQGHARTRVDWRHYEVHSPMRKGSLPPEVAERCRALVRGYGLTFSAMDIIVTPDGRYVFLENNPNGQWYFCEQRVPELKILDSIARCLHRGEVGTNSLIREALSRPSADF